MRLLVALTLAAAALPAQTITGSIVGSVRDPGGASIAGPSRRRRIPGPW